MSAAFAIKVFLSLAMVFALAGLATPTRNDRVWWALYGIAGLNLLGVFLVALWFF